VSVDILKFIQKPQETEPDRFIKNKIKLNIPETFNRNVCFIKFHQTLH
jgi:hypothetical protein